MGRRRVAALVPLLVLVLSRCAWTWPRAQSTIVFTDNRFGSGWDRFAARVSSFSTGTGQAEGRRAVYLPPLRDEPRRRSSTLAFARLAQEEAKPAPGAAAEPAWAASSSAIIFPGYAPLSPPPPPAEKIPKVTPEEELGMPECDGEPFRALDAASGRCRALTMRSECAAGEWFILDRETRTAACRPHPCPAGFAMHRDACHDLADPSVCSPNMVLQVDEFGDATCDCARSCVFWPAQERCYPALLRGPCAVGQQLIVNGSDAMCAENPCVDDGWARWPATGVCHRLRDVDDAPCTHGRMDVNPLSLELECNTAVPNSVFVTRSVRCATGSRRSQGGRCKRQLRRSVPGRSPFGGGGGRCPSGFTETPDGGCRRSSGNFGGLG